MRRLLNWWRCAREADLTRRSSHDSANDWAGHEDEVYRLRAELERKEQVIRSLQTEHTLRTEELGDARDNWVFQELESAQAQIKTLLAEIEGQKVVIDGLKCDAHDDGLLRVRYASSVEDLRDQLRHERASHRLTLACLERFVLEHGITQVIDTTALAQARAQMQKHHVNYSNLGDTPCASST